MHTKSMSLLYTFIVLLKLRYDVNAEIIIFIGTYNWSSGVWKN